MEKPNLHGEESTAIKQVTHGQELVMQLRSLLLQDRHQPNNKFAESLLDEALRSLDMALFHIKICDSVERSRAAARAIAMKPKLKLGDKSKKNQHSWTIITSSPFKDGHHWRKYGQKNIFNTKYPRCYYRCTYSEERNCTAKKQVQQRDGHQELPEYMVMYSSKHTCGTKITPCESILSNIADLDRRCVISMASDKPDVLQQVEMEKEEEELLDMITKSDNFLSNASDHSFTSSCGLPMDACLYDEFFEFNNDGLEPF